MKRLVYAPRAYVFIKDKYGKIHDLSRYVVSGSVDRVTDAVSSARFTIRNPEMIFTARQDDKGDPIMGPFSPMDPVTIYLRRYKNHPVRVFTGYLDDVPFIELYPGTIDFEASCTLKRLQYTFYDFGLPYMQTFLQTYGWLPRGDGVFSSSALNEFKLDDPDRTGTDSDSDALKLESGGVHGSIGQLLFATMKHIGGWDPEDLLVEALPGDIFSRLATLATRNIEESTNTKFAMETFFSKVIGEGSFGNAGSGNINLDGIDGSVAEQVYQVGLRKGVKGDSKLMVSAFMTGLVESNFRNLPGGDRDSEGWRQERKSIYPNPQNVPESANRYFTEGLNIMAGKNPGKAGTGMYQDSWSPGRLSQAIQGSAFPDRYDERKSDALALLRRTADKVGESPDPDGEDSVDEETPDKVTTTKNSGTSGGDGKFYSPIRGLQMKMGSVPSSTGGAFGAPRNYAGGHAGVDTVAALGTTLYAITDSVCVYAGDWGSSEGKLILLQTKNSVPGYSGRVVMGYGHASEVSVSKGDTVKGGAPIGKSGAGSNGQPHLHFFVRQDATPANGTMNPMPLIKAGVTGEQPTGEVSGSNTTSDSGSSPTGDVQSAAAQALGSALTLPGALNSAESRFLGNERSLMNDQPLLPFIQQLSQASFRHFQSMPDGKFYAFYPDYFGEMKHHEPYWEIEDIEILSGKVRLTDDALLTHSFVIGDTASEFGGSTPEIRALRTAGIVTIFNAFTAKNPEATRAPDPEETPEEKKSRERNVGEGQDSDLGSSDLGLGLGILMQEDEALKFLERYGARPDTEDMPMIHNPQYELFMAYQRFMMGWSRQFLTPFTFTFMPELYPGGKVGFPQHGLQMYIESVSHSWDYKSGFTTTASLTAPSVYGNARQKNLLPTNMIRAIIEPANTAAARRKSEADAVSKQAKTAWDGLTHAVGKAITDGLEDLVK